MTCHIPILFLTTKVTQSVFRCIGRIHGLLYLPKCVNGAPVRVMMRQYFLTLVWPAYCQNFQSGAQTTTILYEKRLVEVAANTSAFPNHFQPEGTILYNRHGYKHCSRAADQIYPPAPPCQEVISPCSRDSGRKAVQHGVLNNRTTKPHAMSKSVDSNAHNVS